MIKRMLNKKQTKKYIANINSGDICSPVHEKRNEFELGRKIMSIQ